MRWLAFGMIAVTAFAWWIATERSRFTAEIRANIRSIPLVASCDTDGNLIDRGLANCVDVDGRFRIVHSLITKVFSLEPDTSRPIPFVSFSADTDIDHHMDDALVQFRDALAQAARQQQMSAGR